MTWGFSCSAVTAKQLQKTPPFPVHTYNMGKVLELCRVRQCCQEMPDANFGVVDVKAGVQVASNTWTAHFR